MEYPTRKMKASSAPARPPTLDGYVFTERLGIGTYATVYKVYRKSGEQRNVHAVKCIRKSGLTHSSVENLLNEIEILKQIDHPNIVKMVDFQWDASYIYIIMEYCAGGDLSRFISTRRVLPEYVVKRFLQQIASALELLHSHNISHMDLKPQNILLSSEDQPILKLADFGFAQFIDSGENDSLKGSPLYMAPEMITKRRYTSKVDLWSVGVILYECLFGKAPFASKSFVELEMKIKSDKPIELPHYPRLSEECKSLLQSLLQRNPDHRISFEEFFLHPFVDLEHRPSPNCLPKGTDIVTDAVAKDREGKYAEAAKLYQDAVKYFIPAIYYESDKRKKEALRKKVKEYVGRAEVLSSVSSDDGVESSQQKDFIDCLSKSYSQVSSAFQMLGNAREKEGDGKLQEAMTLYESALEILITVSSKESDPDLKKFLHRQIESHLKRAEIVREHLKASSENDTQNHQCSSRANVLDSEDKAQRCCLQ